MQAAAAGNVRAVVGLGGPRASSRGRPTTDAEGPIYACSMRAMPAMNAMTTINVRRDVYMRRATVQRVARSSPRRPVAGRDPFPGPVFAESRKHVIVHFTFGAVRIGQNPSDEKMHSRIHRLFP